MRAMAGVNHVSSSRSAPAKMLGNMVADSDGVAVGVGVVTVFGIDVDLRRSHIADERLVEDTFFPAHQEDGELGEVFHTGVGEGRGAQSGVVGEAIGLDPVPCSHTTGTPACRDRRFGRKTVSFMSSGSSNWSCMNCR